MYLIKKDKGNWNDSKIIFLNTKLQDNESRQIGGSGGTGNHTIEAGLNAFNTQCGITNTNITPNTYIVDNGSSPSEEEITSNVEYK